jgi:hypothetical protein
MRRRPLEERTNPKEIGLVRHNFTPLKLKNLIFNQQRLTDGVKNAAHKRQKRLKSVVFFENMTKLQQLGNKIKQGL